VRKKNSKKGDNGRVLVVSGSKDYPGASYLSGVAALRMGADMVTFAVPEKVAWTINSLCPDLLTKKFPGEYLSIKHYDKIKKLLLASDVFLIGPGLGKKLSTKRLIKKIVKNSDLPKVIDADAIKALCLQDISNAIITPHEKEYEILLKNSGIKQNNVLNHIRNNIILLKGPVDTIISREKITKIKSGNPGMSVGGTGDILAGICIGLVSQGKNKYHSAISAAKLMGKIGDKLEKKYGYGFIASDFLGEIARVNSKYLNIY